MEFVDEDDKSLVELLLIAQDNQLGEKKSAEEDCKALLEQVNAQEKELRNKRRWLLGLTTFEDQEADDDTDEDTDEDVKTSNAEFERFPTRL
uniref:Uncharacterized protein n=1 Tax=Helianthus annuus TaxID=4232 RepID=A0A251T6C5_HELAN